MFGLDLLIAGAIAVGLDFTLHPDDFYVYPRAGEVAYVSFHIDKRKEDGACKFTGLMTPYERDWVATVDNGITEQQLPPEPGKVAGYAVVINKKACPGKPDEAMLSTAEAIPVVRFSADNPRKIPLLPSAHLQAVSVAGKKESELPKWLPQVMKTIEAAAETSKDAKAFVEFSREAAKAGKVANTEEGAPKPN